MADGQLEQEEEEEEEEEKNNKNSNNNNEYKDNSNKKRLCIEFSLCLSFANTQSPMSFRMMKKCYSTDPQPL
jgi:thermostable 8-oxoguanine DNA glycosylase